MLFSNWNATNFFFFCSRLDLLAFDTALLLHSAWELSMYESTMLLHIANIEKFTNKSFQRSLVVVNAFGCALSCFVFFRRVFVWGIFNIRLQFKRFHSNNSEMLGLKFTIQWRRMKKPVALVNSPTGKIPHDLDYFHIDCDEGRKKGICDANKKSKENF